MNSEVIWRHGKMYEGQTVVILGQGPSVNNRDAVAQLSHNFITIAIKDTFRVATLLNTDIIYACDKQWWKRTWLKNDGLREQDAIKVVLDYEKLELGIPGLKFLYNKSIYNFVFEEGAVAHGQNSGHSAINLAVNLGAKKIILLGYDMQAVDGKTHFESCPHVPIPHDVFPMFRQNLVQAAKLLVGKVDVVNCSPNSALKCFIHANIDEAIEWGMQ